MTDCSVSFKGVCPNISGHRPAKADTDEITKQCDMLTLSEDGDHSANMLKMLLLYSSFVYTYIIPEVSHSSLVTRVNHRKDQINSWRESMRKETMSRRRKVKSGFLSDTLTMWVSSVEGGRPGTSF